MTPPQDAKPSVNCTNFHFVDKTTGVCSTCKRQVQDAKPDVEAMADEFADGVGDPGGYSEWYLSYSGFKAGHSSRDEEVQRLKNKLADRTIEGWTVEDYEEEVARLKGIIQNQSAAIDSVAAMYSNCLEQNADFRKLLVCYCSKVSERPICDVCEVLTKHPEGNQDE